MFENDVATVKALLNNNVNFRRLHTKHTDLNVAIDAVNAGERSMDQLTLETLKKRKLRVADEMQDLIRAHHAGG
ncbi:MAG: YdcH family protein [Gammaproteobacteria bacterium]